LASSNAIMDDLSGTNLKDYAHYINGAFAAPVNGDYFNTENPTTGKPWARVARGTKVDVDLAVDSAKRALPAWAAMTPSKRGYLLYALADQIEKNASYLAKIEVCDNGKLYAEMFSQMGYIAKWYRYYGGLADKIEGAVLPTDKSNIFNFIRYEPLGVIGMITPWNSPLLLLTWKLAPALAAGNVAVIKPSEFASISTLEFIKLFCKSGFPAGVVNAVTGTGLEAGKPLVDNEYVAKIAFTGSNLSGQKIYESAARSIKHVCLELGGKSPNIVFADANLDAAVMGVISGIFGASGQTCIAGSRLLLESSIYGVFMKKLLAVASAAKIGNPMEKDTDVGPIATRPQFDKVLEYIAIAKKEGATCVLGGGPYTGPGATSDLFVQPSIFTNVTNDMRIAREEVFGPLLAVISFDDEDEAYSIANDTAFGLGAGIWTSDIRKAIDGSAKIEAGTVWVNTYRALSYTSPFGGYKRSGIGREGGAEAIKEYLQTKSVWICTDPTVDNPFIMR